MTGQPLPLPAQRRSGSAMWLWADDRAQAALASDDLARILRTYRVVTGASQRRLAELLGYDATYILDRPVASGIAIPPQWQAILQVTTGEVLLARTDTSEAEGAFRTAIVIAEEHRLPRQIQRTIRACAARLPAVAEHARRALDTLRVRDRQSSGHSWTGTLVCMCRM